MFEIDRLGFDIQFGSQTDDTDDNAGPDGDVWGLTAVYYALYDFDEHLGFELIYTDMHQDGEFVRLMANYGF
jgi:hypothetical protein